MMRKIVNDETITDDDETKEVMMKLLMAEKFTVKYSPNNTINAISREELNSQ